MFRVALSIRPSPRTVIAGVTRLRHTQPFPVLRSFNHQNKHQGSRLLVVSCTRSPNIPNEAPNAGVVEAFHSWERSRMSTLACSGSARSETAVSAEKTVNGLDERAMRETRFGARNWYLRQDGETEERQRRPLTGRVPVPAGLAMAMAMSVKTETIKMRERSLSGITLVYEERCSRRPVVPVKPKWLSLC